MKTLKFTDELTQLILRGEKTSTWRLFDDKNLEWGDLVTFINKATGETFGAAVLQSVIEKSLAELSDDDWVGHEKFTSEEAMYAAYKTYYPNQIINEDTRVKIIHFTFTPKV